MKCTHIYYKNLIIFRQVKYSIVQQPNQKGTKFTVDEETGEVSTNKVFDREGDDGKFVSVTVKATDQGEPSLEGVCSFTGNDTLFFAFNLFEQNFQFNSNVVICSFFS